MKRQPKSGISDNSRGAADKLVTCLNHKVTLSPEYQKHRDYFDACARWWSELKPEDREKALTVIDAYTHNRREGAERIAATLPSAPKCPL